jgi:hypothetical protein
MNQRSPELSFQHRDSAVLAEPHAGANEAEPAPVGTLFLMMLFLAATAGLWGTLHWILLTG